MLRVAVAIHANGDATGITYTSLKANLGIPSRCVSGHMSCAWDRWGIRSAAFSLPQLAMRWPSKQRTF